MTVPKIKICGLRTLRDLEICLRAGVDAIGLLVGRVHASRDFISLETAREIARRTPPFITPTLVTHLEDMPEVARLAHAAGCRAIQLHGEMTKADVEAIRKLTSLPLIARVSVEDTNSIDRARELAEVADALVLDSIDRAANQVGGTGHTHDWSISARIRRAVTIPVILAGGLTPANAAAAIQTVKPWAVDVNTGVKGKDGGKSAHKIMQFVRQARQA
jgi:phosphoribosylanthranilate isomerase